MKTNHIIFLIVLASLLCGCASTPSGVTPVMSTAEYASREPIATSLFPSDQAVLGDEAVERILSRKLELPARAKLALMKFPDPASGGYGRYYWREEEFLKLRQGQVDTFSKALLASDQIAEVTPLPALMTPSHLSIPVLREAAVRMQADLLLVFRVGSDTYSQVSGLRQRQGESVQHLRTRPIGRADRPRAIHARGQSGTPGVEGTKRPGPFGNDAAGRGGIGW